MTTNQPKVIFFIGIGGIGMSALARYYLALGRKVFGYDKTRSDLTDSLTQEGAVISYDDVWQENECFSKESTLVMFPVRVNLPFP